MSHDLVVGMLVLAQAPPSVSVGVLVLGIISLVLGVYLTWSASQDAKTYKLKLEEMEQEKEQLKAAPVSAKAQPSQSKSEPKPKAQKSSLEDDVKAAQAAQEALRKELEQLKSSHSSLKDENKSLREKQHLANQELSELRQKDKAARERKGSDADSNTQEALINLRLELSDALGQAAIHQERVRELEAQLKSSRAEAKKTKKERDEAPAQAAPVVEAAPAASAQQADKGADQEQSAKLERELKSLRSQLSAAQQEKDSLERELREKLKRTARKVEDERRRADNNDKAYLITQRELDAARERLRLLDDQLNRAEFVASTAINHMTSAPAPADEAPAAPAPKEEAVAAQAPAVEPVAEPAAEVTAEPAAETAPVEAQPEPAAEPEVEPAVEAEVEAEAAPQEAPEQEVEIDESLRAAVHAEPEGLSETSGVDEAWADLEDEI